MGSRTSGALLGFALLTAGYLLALIWADSRHQVFSQLPTLAFAMPMLLVASSMTYLIRYLRWHWLLRRSGHATPLLRGFAAYLSGFAFTATPGKVGELVRIRYLAPLKVPPARVVAAFIFERAFDLIAVLMLSSLAIASTRTFIISAVFVMAFLSGLALASAKLEWFAATARSLDERGFRRTAMIVTAIKDGLSDCRIWMTPADIAVSLVFGLIAWSIASLAFLFLLERLDITIAFTEALSIYPMSMLAGAASMLPGGVGSTEATIVGLLSLHDVPLGLATLAAVGIRLSSLWFAVVCGFVSVLGLELLKSPNRGSCDSR
jgi:uncharacterized protein (TIRG00374 family)